MGFDLAAERCPGHGVYETSTARRSCSYSRSRKVTTRPLSSSASIGGIVGGLGGLLFGVCGGVMWYMSKKQATAPK